MQLDADHHDALREIVNVAMGQAGESLAKTLDRFVHLTIPQVFVLDSGRLGDAVAPRGWAEREVTVIREAFFGLLDGEALTLVDLSGGGADLLGTGTDLGPRELALEIANMLVGACLDGISAQLGYVVGYSPPNVICERDPAGKALGRALTPEEPRLLTIAIDFHVDASPWSSRVVLVFAPQAAANITASVARFLAAVSGD
jgi:chemotaxis protein CheC